jgi:hypothetical protein
LYTWSAEPAWKYLGVGENKEKIIKTTQTNKKKNKTKEE